MLSIHDVTLKRGPVGGTKTMTFHVVLDAPSDSPVSVVVATGDFAPAVNHRPRFGAVAGQDYDAASATITFAPGETSKPFPVTIHGSNPVVDRFFLVHLSNASAPVRVPGLAAGILVGHA